MSAAVRVLAFFFLTPPPAIDQWVKLVLAVILPVSVFFAFLAGAILLIAWKGLQTGRSAWRSMASEWKDTEEFRSAVNAVRKNAELEFRLLMSETIAGAVKSHNEDHDAHGAILRNRRSGD